MNRERLEQPPILPDRVARSDGHLRSAAALEPTQGRSLLSASWSCSPPSPSPDGSNGSPAGAPRNSSPPCAVPHHPDPSRGPDRHRSRPPTRRRAHRHHQDPRRCALIGPSQDVHGHPGLATKLVLLKPRDPESKGIVERPTGWFEKSFMPDREFASPADSNDQFTDWLAGASRRRGRGGGRSPLHRRGSLRLGSERHHAMLQRAHPRGVQHLELSLIHI